MQRGEKKGGGGIIIRSERGIALLEFALSLPVLVMALFGGVEFVNMYNQKHRIANVARQVVQAAHDGIVVTNSLTSQNPPDDELASTVGESLTVSFADRVDDLLEEAFPDDFEAVVITVRILRLDTSAPLGFRDVAFISREKRFNGSAVILQAYGGGALPKTAASDGTSGSLPPTARSNLVSSHISSTGVATVVEVFYRYRPVTPLGNIFQLGQDMTQFAMI